MRSVFGRTILVATLVSLAVMISCAPEPVTERPDFALVIHGGAGTIVKDEMTPELENRYREKLTEALTRGSQVLDEGGSAVDAVEAAILILEDSPLFNAGKGAVFTAAGKNELDASIMDGETLDAGAVGSVTTIKNPISAARAVLDHSRHVLLVGAGAEMFAAERGLEIVKQDYFFDQNRWNQLLKAKESKQTKEEPTGEDGDRKFGTVGALALDRRGNLAAGTSTGGLTNKRHGRVGDSPVIGAGTYADNATCAVSGTGQGEYFMRFLVAYDVSARMAYEGLSLEEAADRVVHGTLTEAGGEGGIIALDKDGKIAMPFNTPGMYRGWVVSGGDFHVMMYKE